MGFLWEKKVHTTTITVFDRDSSYQQVGELPGNCRAKSILLRVGYPMDNHNVAIIFLILEMTTDELGALTGKLGQIPTVKVKSMTLKV
ncbi:MAG: iron-only hydrogenase system regulator [Candidatus Marinimicrobia bacterium]|nr:iron-only hydrogenase system regulator [Candidatus Neomarinimicrobiota bacterium]